MAALTDGLYGYEIVMLVLGIILFIVSLFGLIQGLRKGTNVTPLLAFFGLSIAMVGYPSVQSITLGKDELEIEKSTHELTQSPTNTGVRQSVQSTLSKIENRPIADPQKLTLVAAAQYALGQDSAAKQNLQKVLQTSPNLADAKALQQKIEFVDKVTNLTTQVESNPANGSAKQSLQSTLSEATKFQFANPGALTQLARGQAAI